MACRRSAVLGLLGLAVPVLGSCGFRPLLAEPDSEGRSVAQDLAAIEVQGLQRSRMAQLVRIGLLDQLNPTSASVPNRYQLRLRLRRSTRAVGVQLDNTVTRYNLTLAATFTLVDAADGERLYGFSVRRVASYNVSREPYADLVAEEDAERRAAREVAVDIRNLLAAHFVRQGEAA